MTEGIPLKMASRSESRVLEKYIELEEYVIDMPSDLEPTEWPECCIYRVPKRLRKVNEEAYNPNLVSIGPLHHGKEELKEMEQQKGRYLKEFCCRTKTNPEDLALIINEEKEAKIRHCYAEPSRLIKSKEFVKMILMDGIFIIELFLRNSDLKQRRNDYILRKPWMRNSIRQDLILLENQLPFFVLDDLYKSVDNGFVSFLQLSCNYFSDYDQRKKEPINDEEVKHFTDLLRNFFVPSKLKSEEDGDDLLYSATKLDEAGVRSVDLLYSATKLDEAGVQFKPDDNLDKTEIQFQKGKCLENYPFLNCSWLLNCLPCLQSLDCLKSMQAFLEIRALTVDDMTEYVFRNLITTTKLIFSH